MSDQVTRDSYRDRVLAAMTLLDEANVDASVDGEPETLREGLRKGISGCQDSIDSLDELDRIEGDQA